MVRGKDKSLSSPFFEYIAGMTIGDIAAQVSTGLDSKFFHGVFAILIFASVPFFCWYSFLKKTKPLEISLKENQPC